MTKYGEKSAICLFVCSKAQEADRFKRECLFQEGLPLCQELKSALGKAESVVRYSYSGGKVTERVLDPYHLFWGEGNLYLAAYCHLHHEVRNFRIDRFKSVKAQKS